MITLLISNHWFHLHCLIATWDHSRNTSTTNTLLRFFICSSFLVFFFPFSFLTIKVSCNLSKLKLLRYLPSSALPLLFIHFNCSGSSWSRLDQANALKGYVSKFVKSAASLKTSEVIFKIDWYSLIVEFYTYVCILYIFLFHMFHII